MLYVVVVIVVLLLLLLLLLMVKRLLLSMGMSLEKLSHTWSHLLCPTGLLPSELGKPRIGDTQTQIQVVSRLCRHMTKHTYIHIHKNTDRGAGIDTT